MTGFTKHARRSSPAFSLDLRSESGLISGYQDVYGAFRVDFEGCEFLLAGGLEVSNSTVEHPDECWPRSVYPELHPRVPSTQIRRQKDITLASLIEGP